VTWDAVEEGLSDRLVDLHQQVHTTAGTGRSRRSGRNIPKPDGRLRPLWIAALEDKIVQQSVAQVLGAIYRGDFLVSLTYGLPSRSASHSTMRMR